VARHALRVRVTFLAAAVFRCLRPARAAARSAPRLRARWRGTIRSGATHPSTGWPALLDPGSRKGLFRWGPPRASAPWDRVRGLPPGRGGREPWILSL